MQRVAAMKLRHNGEIKIYQPMGMFVDIKLTTTGTDCLYDAPTLFGIMNSGSFSWDNMITSSSNMETYEFSYRRYFPQAY